MGRAVALLGRVRKDQTGMLIGLREGGEVAAIMEAGAIFSESVFGSVWVDSNLDATTTEGSAGEAGGDVNESCTNTFTKD